MRPAGALCSWRHAWEGCRPSRGQPRGREGCARPGGAPTRDGTPRREESSGGAGRDPVNGPGAPPWIQVVQGGRRLCLLSKVRSGHGEALGWELSSQKLCYAQPDSGSQGPADHPPGTQPRRPLGYPPGWTGPGRVGRREPREGRLGFPGQSPAGPRLQLRPQAHGLISGKAGHPAMPASRRGRSLS